jgi:hypothetical protein
MSAFHPIANEQRTQFYVGSVPIADVVYIFIPNDALPSVRRERPRTGRNRTRPSIGRTNNLLLRSGNTPNSRADS